MPRRLRGPRKRRRRGNGKQWEPWLLALDAQIAEEDRRDRARRLRTHSSESATGIVCFEGFASAGVVQGPLRITQHVEVGHTQPERPAKSNDGEVSRFYHGAHLDLLDR